MRLFFFFFLFLFSSLASANKPFRNNELPFSEYVEQAREHIKNNRSFVTEDIETEIFYNSPFEKKEPCFDTAKVKRGISVSPWHFRWSWIHARCGKLFC